MYDDKEYLKDAVFMVLMFPLGYAFLVLALCM